MLFEKLANFISQSEHRDRLDPSPPPTRFHSLLKDPAILHPPYALHKEPFIKKGSSKEMEGVNDNASGFMHLNIKTNEEWPKITFKNKPSHLRQKAKSLNFIVMQIREPENEDTLFRE